jgi:ribosomal protein L9
MENQEVFASSSGTQKMWQPSLQSSILRILLILVLVLGGFFVFNISKAFADTASSTKPEAPQSPIVKRINSTTLKLSWKKVEGADGYLIYRYNSGSKTYKREARVTGNKSSWIDKDLKTNRTYAYKLRAFKQVGDKELLSSYTYGVSARTHSNKAKKTNVASIKALKNITMGLRVQEMPEIVLRASSATKQKYPIPVSTKLFYTTSNKNVTVSKNGIVTARKLGTSIITVRAHNGVSTKITIKVVDYAKLKNFDFMMGNFIPTVVDEQKEAICELASYFSKRKNSPVGVLYLDQNDNLMNWNKVNLGTMKDELYQLLYDSPYPMYIYVDKRYIEFTVHDPNLPYKYDESLTFYYSYEPEDIAPSLLYTKVAPHWYFSYFVA